MLFIYLFFNFFYSLQNLFPMHRACLAPPVRFAVLAWKAQKTEIDSCSAVDFFYRHLLGIDRLWKKCIFIIIIFWSATSFSYKFQTWLLKDCLEPMDGEKLCRREGQPPSRVNSACACCLCLALTVLCQLQSATKLLRQIEWLRRTNESAPSPVPSIQSWGVCCFL